MLFWAFFTSQFLAIFSKNQTANPGEEQRTSAKVVWRDPNFVAKDKKGGHPCMAKKEGQCLPAAAAPVAISFVGGERRKMIPPPPPPLFFPGPFCPLLLLWECAAGKESDSTRKGKKRTGGGLPVSRSRTMTTLRKQKNPYLTFR